jgi:hypothetical protein
MYYYDTEYQKGFVQSFKRKANKILWSMEKYHLKLHFKLLNFIY